MASFTATSNSYEGRKLTLTISGSGSSSTNSTILSWTLTSSGGTSNYYDVGETHITINGTEVYSKSLSKVNTTNYSANVFPVRKGSTSGTIEVPHNSDGTKTIDIGFSTRVYYHTPIEYGGQMVLDTIPLSSKPSVSSSSCALGNSVTIYTNRASSSFTHTLETYINNTRIESFSGIGTSKSWTPAIATYAPYITNSESATCTILCKTYNGSTQIGSNEVCSISLSVPSSVKPTAGISISEGNSAISSLGWGVFVRGKSQLSVQVSGSPIYGSAIKSFNSTANNTAYNTSSYKTGTLYSSGTVKATVTDYRNHTSSEVTSNYTVVNYENPAITDASIVRCNSDGTENDNGVYAKYNFIGSISPVNNKNGSEFRIKYKKRSATSYNTLIISNGYTVNQIGVVMAGVTFDTNTSYDFVFEAADTFIASSIEKILDTPFVLQNFHKSGKSMAIGKVSEASDNEHLLEIGIDTDFSGTIKKNGVNIFNLIYPVGAIYISTNSTNPTYLFGGSWKQLTDRFLIGAGSSYSVNSTGGSSSHTHSGPNHCHSGPNHCHSGPSHTHPLGDNGYAKIHHNNSYFWSREIATPGWTDTSKMGSISGSTVSTNNSSGTALGGNTDAAGTGNTGYAGTGNTSYSGTGSTGSASTIPPYLAVYMWERTSL
ncbi:MAG: hypothetical protein IJN13_00500 [Bacilli bacterium]|nr:hypothetical protein [Bacilli bacterium]